MEPHRFVFPKVTEIRVARGQAEAAPRFGSLTQRDLVAASLLMRPGGGDASARPQSHPL